MTQRTWANALALPPLLLSAPVAVAMGSILLIEQPVGIAGAGAFLLFVLALGLFALFVTPFVLDAAGGELANPYLKAIPVLIGYYVLFRTFSEH
jgi:hypothetical protein